MIVIFDGVCNLCNSSVNFIIQRDKAGRFQFVQAQSQAGCALQKQYDIDVLTAETIALIKHHKAYTQSDAAIEIARDLDGRWNWLRFLKIVPRAIRDWAYLTIARNRYRWFGKTAVCQFPSPDIRARFILDEGQNLT